MSFRPPCLTSNENVSRTFRRARVASSACPHLRGRALRGVGRRLFGRGTPPLAHLRVRCRVRETLGGGFQGGCAMNVYNRDALQSVPFRVEEPRLIPTERYYDEEFFRLEAERLWPHVWQMACRLEEIPNVGDFTEYTTLGKSVIIVRTKSGVKAFHNACRHRGVRLVTEPGNCEVRGFNCPFHGWRWNVDGENTF